ncbi:MAG: hypothetical protein GQ583_10365 [Methyloprofundus sp.]|nr:hypothetical protein [Methyloprofundus sp.]
MSNESRKKTDNNSAPDLELEAKQPNKSRRSFAKAGIMAPVMISLANRPAWGGSVRCTVSGFDSLHAIGSGPALADVEAMCDYTSVSGILGTGGVDVNQLVRTFFSCLPGSSTLTVGQALNDSGNLFTQRMVAAHFNETLLGKNPFGGASTATIYCHLIDGGGTYDFGAMILSPLEIINFLGYVGIK